MADAMKPTTISIPAIQPSTVFAALSSDMLPSDPMQEIFDQAEDLADAIAAATGCTGALLTMLDQLAADMPGMLDQVEAVTGAVHLYLERAGKQADSIARLTFV